MGINFHSTISFAKLDSFLIKFPQYWGFLMFEDLRVEYLRSSFLKEIGVFAKSAIFPYQRCEEISRVGIFQEKHSYELVL